MAVWYGRWCHYQAGLIRDFIGHDSVVAIFLFDGVAVLLCLYYLTSSSIGHKDQWQPVAYRPWGGFGQLPRVIKLLSFA